MRAKKVDSNQPAIVKQLKAPVMNANKFHYLIGIDPGVMTGYAVKDTLEGNYTEVGSDTILEAMNLVKLMREHYDCFVRVEDARQRKWFGKTSREVLQGAGSIKRDCQIWEEFLTRHRIPHEFVAPKNNRTKLDSKKFKMFTGWKGRTNEHSRDAGSLLLGY